MVPIVRGTWRGASLGPGHPSVLWAGKIPSSTQRLAVESPTPRALATWGVLMYWVSACQSGAVASWTIRTFHKGLELPAVVGSTAPLRNPKIAQFHVPQEPTRTP